MDVPVTHKQLLFIVLACIAAVCMGVWFGRRSVSLVLTAGASIPPVRETPAET